MGEGKEEGNLKKCFDVPKMEPQFSIPSLPLDTPVGPDTAGRHLHISVTKETPCHNNFVSRIRDQMHVRYFGIAIPVVSCLSSHIPGPGRSFLGS